MSDKPHNRDPAASRDASNHDAQGRFAPGNRANPGGRSKVQREVQAILDEAAPDGAKELIRLCTKAERESDRISAIKLVLEHAIGKPKERDDDGNAITPAIERILDKMMGRSE